MVRQFVVGRWYRIKPSLINKPRESVTNRTCSTTDSMERVFDGRPLYVRAATRRGGSTHVWEVWFAEISSYYWSTKDFVLCCKEDTPPIKYTFHVSSLHAWFETNTGETVRIDTIAYGDDH